MIDSCKINSEMRFIVKNTTFCGLADLVCPYYCRGCGKVGEILCECCKKNIIEDRLNHCPKCGKVISDSCRECRLPFSAEFVVGYRDELIGALAEEFKFFGVRKLGKVLAEILDEFLPDFSQDVSIVPIPTIRRHVRERGLDHTYVVVKELAKIRGWKVEKLLMRKNNTVQLGANAKTRRLQAKGAYEFSGKIDENRIYVLFDDIWTTGASMTEAGKILKENGAKKLVAVVLATNRKGKKPIVKH